MFNIHTLKWDEDLLKLLDIPASMMPEVHGSSEVMAHTKSTIFAHEVPISGVAGDQQAALFGQMCVDPGAIKNTYGTGCFVMLNIGEKPVLSKNNLLTTIAWKIGDTVNYALEGSIYVGGSVVQWLRDGLGIINSSSEVEALASTVPDSGGVFFVPALTGLGAPYWDPYARGTIVGITRGTTAAHIARAALDGIAFQTYDIAQAMAKDMGHELTELKVDGGASRNNLLMQYQANLLGIDVVRPKITETTALGAAYLAGLAVGYWKDIKELKEQWQVIAGPYTGAHLNPSVSVGLAVAGLFPWYKVPVYIVAQMIGGFLGAVIVWFFYKDHMKEKDNDPEGIRTMFCTEPAIRNYGVNFFSEFLATALLVFIIISFSTTGNSMDIENGRIGLAALGPVPVTFLIIALGMSLGGTTGYAMNPARDLSPRIAFAILPIPNKCSPDWAYSWVPVFAPVIGGAVAGACGTWLLSL